MIYRVPQPPLMSLASYKTPHLITLDFFNRFNMLTKFNRHLLGVKLAQQNGIYSTQLGFFFFISSMTVVGLIFRTRAISRIPLPFRLISMICSLIWGNRPKSE